MFSRICLNDTICDYLGDILIVLVSYLGSHSNFSVLRGNTTDKRGWYITIVLSGQILFMTYQAVLTSSFAVVKHKKPFNTLEEFLQSQTFR